MHIIVREKQGNNIDIGVPNFMMNVGIKIALKSVKYSRSSNNNVQEFVNSIDKKYIKMAINDLKRYNGLEIVNVDSKDGDYVSITI